MRLSYSLSKNILETAVGGIFNKFSIKNRRNVFFFDDIPLTYVKECEKEGYENEIRIISQKWMIMALKQLIPSVVKKLLPQTFFNFILKKIWKNMGYMDDIQLIKKDEIVKIKTKNELNVKAIGINNFSIGVYMGVLSALYESQIEVINVEKLNNICIYSFKIKNEPFFVESKDKKLYDKLNYLPEDKGSSLRDALKSHIFQLKRNKIYFRGRGIGIIENTFFHLVGNWGILLERVSQISYNYFKEIVEESSSKEKLILLKTLLQVMGWGVVTIVKNQNEIIVEIKNPPYGFQTEKDNWDFLIRTILGYLWLIDKNFKIKNVETEYKKVHVKYFV